MEKWPDMRNAMPEKSNNTTSILKLAALGFTLVGMIIAGAVAWGQQNEKTTAHERRIRQNEEVVRKLETGQATILERTRQTREITDETKEMVKEVLKELRRPR